MKNLWHIAQLGVKELLSLARDPVLLFLIAYAFTFSVYTPAKSAVMDVVNASVAIVDEDDSAVSRRIRDSLLPPLFLTPQKLPHGEIPSAIDPPAGCHYHPRCPFAVARCREARPPLREISPGHVSACILD